MEFPDEYRYSKDHEWVSDTDGEGIAAIGVTEYAIEQLGDIVHIELPQVGDSFEGGAAFGTIESTKTVSDLYAPVGGKVVAINQDVVDNPSMLEDHAYVDGWLIKIEADDSGDVELLTAAEYEKFIAEQD